jgi:septal ring factor EnvC (AmiA/AmiB activator)
VSFIHVKIPLAFSLIHVNMLLTMTATDYKALQEQFRAELQQKEKDRDNVRSQLAALESEINNLETMIETLSALLKKPTRNIKTVALANAILDIFSDDRKTELRPLDVKKQLKERKFNLSGYSQPMAYIHVWLRRFDERGKLKGRKLEGGGWAYKWPDKG